MSAPGRLVAGRYRLQQQIGGGGMGAVWLAMDERLSREVAIKQVLPAPGADAETARQQRERALREGRIAARLSHPHAISVYDVALEDDQPWLVMEYLPSRSLATVLAQDGVLRVDQAAQIGAQVADALAATHAAGIVHRDVKPANVLIGQGGRVEGLVKITDFGISHASGDVTLTHTGQITGTPAYLPPEVARGTEPGPAADVFSLGATLYACLEGEPPFGRGQNALQQLHRVAAGNIDPPTRSGALTDPLLRMLAADPGDRPSMEDVRDELVALAAGRDGDATMVLAAPTDISSPGGQVVDRTPSAPTAAAGVGALASDDEPRTARQPTADSAAPPVVPPAHVAVFDDDERPPRRLAPLALAAAAVVALLLGIAAWSFLGDDGDGRDVASSDTTSSTTAVPTTTTTAAPASTPAPEPTAPTTAATPTTVATTVTTEAAPQPEATTTTAAREAAGGEAEIEARSIERYLDEYHRLVIDDPVAAYRQAGPTLRNAISESGFVDFWGRFDDVSVSEVRVEGRDAAEANLALRFTDGSQQVERHRFEFIADGGNLVLDRDTFIATVG